MPQYFYLKGNLHDFLAESAEIYETVFFKKSLLEPKLVLESKYEASVYGRVYFSPCDSN